MKQAKAAQMDLSRGQLNNMIHSAHVAVIRAMDGPTAEYIQKVRALEEMEMARKSFELKAAVLEVYADVVPEPEEEEVPA